LKKLERFDIIFYYININQGNMEDRRKSKRFKIDEIEDTILKCSIIMDEKELVFKPINFSSAGISFKADKTTADSINNSSSFKFQFLLNEKTIINALGKVVWKTHIGSSDEDYYSMGFHLFISDQTALKTLDSFLNNLK